MAHRSDLKDLPVISLVRMAHGQLIVENVRSNIGEPAVNQAYELNATSMDGKKAVTSACDPDIATFWAVLARPIIVFLI